MKKLLLIMTISMVLTLLCSSFAMATTKLMFSYDMAGDYRSYNGDDWFDNDAVHYDVDPGYSIGYEYTSNMRRVELGFGLETQLNRSITQFKNSEFGFTPVYGVVYVNFTNEGDMIPFFVGRLGVNMLHYGNDSYKNDIFSSDSILKGGLYYALGFGFNSEHNMGAILYSSNYGYVNSDSANRDSATYSKFSLVYGIKF
jgi:hypothetical protein